MKLIAVGCLALAVLAAVAVSQYRHIQADLRASYEAIDTAWQQVDDDVEKRADLVPNLTASVARFVPPHPAITGKLTAARETLLSDQTAYVKITAYNEMNAAIGSLLALAEKTPALRRRRDFLALEYELESTENRIAQSRSQYNDAVQKYNIKLALFPANFVAAMSGYRPWTAYFRTPAHPLGKEANGS